MQRMVDIGDRVAPLTLYDADGNPVELADLLDRPTVVPLVRYYGCMPCRAFLHELDDVRAELDQIGVRVIAVGGAADYQARDLMEHGIAFPLLLDPTHRLYGALDLRHIPWSALLQPVTWRNYLRSARRARQGRITDHPLQAPGLAILDADLTVVFLHRGKTLGDYPPVPRILAAACDAASR
ncbi:MAG: AhpC/TSA family protein [Catenulispora sp.]|nr:AhpC/TSA family protein [Catenulispora sp.]